MRGVVRPTGFEPVTHCLEGSCSIQLSYERLQLRAPSTAPIFPMAMPKPIPRTGSSEDRLP